MHKPSPPTGGMNADDYHTRLTKVRGTEAHDALRTEYHDSHTTDYLLWALETWTASERNYLARGDWRGYLIRASVEHVAAALARRGQLPAGYGQGHLLL